MNIMFEDSITDDQRSKYILLELDTFYFAGLGKKRTAFCLIENAPIMEMIEVDRMLELHSNLMKNYRLQNWNYCEGALEHLTGRWNKEADSFYSTLRERISELKVTELSHLWDGTVQKD